MAVTQARLDSFRAEVDACGDAAATYVEELIGAILAEHPDASVAEVRDAAVDAVGDALYAFGDQASELALDLFEEIVPEDAVESGPAIYDTVADDMVEGGVRYLARKLVEGKVEEFARDLADLTRYYVKRSSFENMVENCWRNDVRWARVPTGLETCGFCFMLSSRGFAYGSERTASQKKEGGAYHEHCDCIAVPGFDGLDWDAQIEGYEPNRMRGRWAECAEAVGEDPDSEDEAVRKRIQAEVETRDWNWLYEGKVPEITFETDALRLETERNRPQEIETATRLREFGIAPDFVVDSIEYVDEKTGFVQFIGLADFASGYEIKTLESAASYNTINGYLKNTSHKANAKCVCFDNSAGVIADDVLVGHITRSRSFHRGRVYIIDSSGRYRFIR